MNEFYQGVAVRPCDSLKCEGRQAERSGCCCALAALLLWACAGVRSEAGTGRQQERGAVARSTPGLPHCAPARRSDPLSGSFLVRSHIFSFAVTTCWGTVPDTGM